MRSPPRSPAVRSLPEGQRILQRRPASPGSSRAASAGRAPGESDGSKAQAGAAQVPRAVRGWHAGRDLAHQLCFQRCPPRGRRHAARFLWGVCFGGDWSGRVAGLSCPLPGATPAPGPGCPHHPVTMVPIQPFIPEGKNVSRKETKTEKGNSQELSVQQVPRVVAADKATSESGERAAPLSQPQVPSRRGAAAAAQPEQDAGALLSQHPVTEATSMKGLPVAQVEQSCAVESPTLCCPGHLLGSLPHSLGGVPCSPHSTPGCRGPTFSSPPADEGLQLLGAGFPRGAVMLFPTVGGLKLPQSQFGAAGGGCEAWDGARTGLSPLAAQHRNSARLHRNTPRSRQCRAGPEHPTPGTPRAGSGAPSS